MNKSFWLTMAAVACVLVGIMLKDVSKVLALMLILPGLAALFVLLYVTAFKNANRCPRCGCMLYPGTKMLKEKKDGMIRCPKCEIMIRVEDMDNSRRL